MITFEDVLVSVGKDREMLITDLVSQMSLREKIKQMTGSTSLVGLLVMTVRYGLSTFDSGKNRRRRIPPIRFTDGPRGVCLGHSTCFPVAMARGATWDVPLQERVGSAIGVEARAQGANFYGGVCINVPRHPGWGRAQEAFSEDPHHLGMMGASMIAGAQRHVMACAKHFACNSIEESRFFVDVHVDERTLREVYLPHFKKCVDDGVASIMSAYNQVNSEFCGHNAHLLRDILKEEWGFGGFVMSDFVFGVRDGKKGVLGGLDIEMPKRWRYGPMLLRRVKRNEVPPDLIDDAVARIIKTKAAFASVGEPGAYDRSKVACAGHVELALEVARKAIVLLKNEGDVLPLGGSLMKRIAVIGELADRGNIGDLGSSRVRPPLVVSPLEGIRKVAPGPLEVVFESGKDLEKAKRAAQEADAAIVIAGLTHRDEGEFMPVVHVGGDREDLRLPRGQEELVKAVSMKSEKCIVVLEGGSAILTSAWQDNVEAILMAWYPGMEGGTAIGEVLFGEVNPSGKLPVTFPSSNEQNPPFDRKAKTAEYGYYHGYRLFDKDDMEPAFAFGFGLSYTSFQFANLVLSDTQIGKVDTLSVKVDVTNTGGVAGEEVVQLYVGCPTSIVARHVKELKGFARVSLEPGETRTVTLKIAAHELAYYDVEAKSFVVEAADYLVLVGSSSKDLPLSATFTVG